MSTYNRIVHALAERATARAVRLVIRRMQGMQNSLLSGDDSGLRNAWDEVCVQVQVQESHNWSAYLDTINPFAAKATERMSREERCAVWLQTPGGEQWVDEVEDQRKANEGPVDESPTYCVEDLVEHITHAACERAINWSNSRIRAHNERSIVD